MQAALDRLQQLRAEGCVVLGDPQYYGRFGFKAFPELYLKDVPPEYFQVIAFNGSIPQGEVVYHEAFNATKKKKKNELFLFRSYGVLKCKIAFN